MSAVKKSISMPLDLWERAEARSKQMSYGMMSRYIQFLVEEDLRQGGAHVRKVANSPKTDDDQIVKAAEEEVRLKRRK